MTARVIPQACPFCGVQNVTEDAVAPGVWAICCRYCGAQGPSSPVGLSHAVSLWNDRAAFRPHHSVSPARLCCWED